jgi:TatD DNase family protein
MLIDSHAHINFNNYKDDGDEVIRRALDENTWMILVGSEYRTSKRALDLANRYERGVYAAVGLHPIHTEEIKAEGDGYSFDTREEEFNYETYEKLAKFEKVVAIGEIGLDYYHLDQSKDINILKARQKKYFSEQLKLAAELGLPAIIHCRQAHDDIIDILADFKKEFKNKLPKGEPWGVMHCFSGDENLAWQYYGLGLLISFTGIITFSKQWDELIRKMPSEKFLIETDCPFLTPEPFRGQRNEPLYVKYVAKRIAEIRKIPIEKVAEISTNNARNLFGV